MARYSKLIAHLKDQASKGKMQRSAPWDLDFLIWSVMHGNGNHETLVVPHFDENYYDDARRIGDGVETALATNFNGALFLLGRDYPEMKCTFEMEGGMVTFAASGPYAGGQIEIPAGDPVPLDVAGLVTTAALLQVIDRAYDLDFPEPESM